MIDDYNASASSIDQLWAQLYGLTQTLNAEAQRHVSEQLSEEELALFDALTRPDITLSTVERAQVKDLVRNLLATLKREKLVLDWRKKQQARASVQVAIEEGLHALPDVYTAALFTDPAARKESASPLRWLDRYCRSASAWRIRRTRAEYIWR